MKQNQHGFSHVILAALIVLVIGIIIFVGYRVSQSDGPKQSTTKGPALISAPKVTPEAKKEVPAQQVSQNNAATPQNSAAVSAPAARTQNATPVSPAPAPQPQKRVINFTKGGGGQQGSVVRVSANLSEAQQGTCTYRFSLNGSVRVEQTSGVSNGNQCFLDVPLSAFPKSAFYSFSLYFVSTDGLVSATQPAYDIEVK